ncbi:MAG: SRPBCC family protein [Euryarchaeota archaeon]|nr:SRPBCC family protein [Euryarchaeota archaeon]
MIRLSGKAAIPRKPTEVSSFLADVANEPNWQKDIVHVALVEGKAGTKGARYERVQVVAGRNIKTVNELVDLVPGRRVVFKAAGKVIEYRLEYELSGTSKTELEMRMEGEMLGFASMFEGMAAEELGAAVPEDLRRLAKVLAP